MVVYVDLLIISTIVVNYIFIKLITLIFKEKINYIRLIISLILTVLMLLLFFLPYKVFFVIRYFMGIIIGIVAFGDKSIKNKIIKIAIYYMLNMAFIGTLVVFNIQSFMPFVISLIYIVALYIVQLYVVKISDKNIYKVLIDKDILKGYFDSGNNVSYNDIPVVFVNKKYFNDNYTYISTINISTVAGKSSLLLYKGPCIIINNTKYNVMYCFNDELEYDVILNNSMRGIL